MDILTQRPPLSLRRSRLVRLYTADQVRDHLLTQPTPFQFDPDGGFQDLYLNLDGTRLNNNKALRLAHALSQIGAVGIETIQARDAGLTSVGASHLLRAIAPLPVVRVLDLSGNYQIDDRIAQDLVQLVEHKASLGQIRLSGTKLTNWTADLLIEAATRRRENGLPMVPELVDLPEGVTLVRRLALLRIWSGEAVPPSPDIPPPLHQVVDPIQLTIPIRVDQFVGAFDCSDNDDGAILRVLARTVDPDLDDMFWFAGPITFMDAIADHADYDIPVRGVTAMVDSLTAFYAESRAGTKSRYMGYLELVPEPTPEEEARLALGGAELIHSINTHAVLVLAGEDPTRRQGPERQRRPWLRIFDSNGEYHYELEPLVPELGDLREPVRWLRWIPWFMLALHKAITKSTTPRIPQFGVDQLALRIAVREAGRMHAESADLARRAAGRDLKSLRPEQRRILHWNYRFLADVWKSTSPKDIDLNMADLNDPWDLSAAVTKMLDEAHPLESWRSLLRATGCINSNALLDGLAVTSREGYCAHVTDLAVLLTLGANWDRGPTNLGDEIMRALTDWPSEELRSRVHLSRRGMLAVHSMELWFFLDAFFGATDPEVVLPTVPPRASESNDFITDLGELIPWVPDRDDDDPIPLDQLPLIQRPTLSGRLRALQPNLGSPAYRDRQRRLRKISPEALIDHLLPGRALDPNFPSREQARFLLSVSPAQFGPSGTSDESEAASRDAFVSGPEEAHRVMRCQWLVTNARNLFAAWMIEDKRIFPIESDERQRRLVWPVDITDHYVREGLNSLLVLANYKVIRNLMAGGRSDDDETVAGSADAQDPEERAYTMALIEALMFIEGAPPYGSPPSVMRQCVARLINPPLDITPSAQPLTQDQAAPLLAIIPTWPVFNNFEWFSGNSHVAAVMAWRRFFTVALEAGAYPAFLIDTLAHWIDATDRWPYPHLLRAFAAEGTLARDVHVRYTRALLLPDEEELALHGRDPRNDLNVIAELRTLAEPPPSPPPSAPPPPTTTTTTTTTAPSPESGGGTPREFYDEIRSAYGQAWGPWTQRALARVLARDKVVTKAHLRAFREMGPPRNEWNRNPFYIYPATGVPDKGTPLTELLGLYNVPTLTLFMRLIDLPQPEPEPEPEPKTT